MQAQHVEMVPLGRMKPAGWNPRLLKTERFQNLCASMKADPDFLWRRPILALSDGTIYAGNQRYRAAEALGWTDVPAILEDVPVQLAQERALRDNQSWGEWQEDDLAELLYGLRESGSDVDLLGFDSAELDRLLGTVSGLDVLPPDVPDSAAYNEQYGVIVICANETEQRAAYEALTADGYACRVVVT